MSFCIVVAEESINRNATVQSLLATGAKPSFLLWEKVYQKLAEAEDQVWLLRAGEAVLSFYKDEMMKSEQTRYVWTLVEICPRTHKRSAMVGNIFLHLAVEGSSADIRRLAITSMNAQASKLPEIVNRAVSASLKAHLVKEASPSKAQTSEDSDSKAVNKEGRLCAFLISCAAVGEDVDVSIRENLVVDLVVVSHHPALGAFYPMYTLCSTEYVIIVGGGARIPWIELCQAASVDPHSTSVSHWARILAQIIAASEVKLNSIHGTMTSNDIASRLRKDLSMLLTVQ